MALSEVDKNARETVKVRSLKRQKGQVNLSKGGEKRFPAETSQNVTIRRKLKRTESYAE